MIIMMAKRKKHIVSCRSKKKTNFATHYAENDIEPMCQTAAISERLGRIGRRSFDRRMRMASPMYVERQGELGRLLNEVDKLSELLHENFPTISAEDYKQFGPELKIVISTLKHLRKEGLLRRELAAGNERMRRQIIDLEELDHDIKTFRVNAPQNAALQQALSAVGSLDLSQLL